MWRFETLEWFPRKNKSKLKNRINSIKIKNKELRWANIVIANLDKQSKLVIINCLIRIKQSQWNNWKIEEIS